MRGSDMEKIKPFFNSIGHFFKEKFQNHRESVKQEKYEKEHDLLFKRKKAEKVAFVIMFVVFALFALSFIFPFLWILMNSFKTKSEFAKDFMSWPAAWNWDNFPNDGNVHYRRRRRNACYGSYFFLCSLCRCQIQIPRTWINLWCRYLLYDCTFGWRLAFANSIHEGDAPRSN